MILFLRFISTNNTEVSVCHQHVAALEEWTPEWGVPAVAFTKDRPTEGALEEVVEVRSTYHVGAAAVPGTGEAQDTVQGLPDAQIKRTPILRIHFAAGGHLDVQGTREDYMRKLQIVLGKQAARGRVALPGRG
jgi:hypothetical protein